MKEEKYITGLCNLAAAIMIIGIAMCAAARTESDLYKANFVMAVGALFGIVFGYAHERMRPLHLRPKKILKENFDYIYVQQYLFIDYLKDNSSDLAELLQLLEEAPDSTLLFNRVYFNYMDSARGDIVQSREQVKSMIERERRKQDGRKKIVRTSGKILY